MADVAASDEDAAPANAPEEMPTEDALSDAASDKPEAAGDSPELPDAAAPVADAAKEAGAAEVAEAAGPRDAPTVTPAALAKAAHERGDSGPEDGGREPKDDNQVKRAHRYLSWYALAEALTFVKDDPAHPQLDEQRQAIEQTVQAFAGDKKRLEALAFNAPRWLAFTKRTTAGIMLAGTVQTVEHVGKLYRVEIRLGTAANAPLAMVVSPTDPHLTPNDEAVTLGSIVDHPAEQLTDYDGPESSLVWNGMTLKVPK